MLAAGCIGAAGARTAPAEALLSTARQAAAERIDDPKLVQVEGVEPPHRIETDDQMLVVHEDPEPGDGHAPGWSYTFLGRERAARVAVRDGGEIVAEAVDASPGDLEPLGDWSLDSDGAADAIVRHPNVSEVGEDVIVEWTLAGGAEPVWEATLASAGSISQQEIVVDARSAEVLGVSGCRDATDRSGSGVSYHAEGPVAPGSEMDVSLDLEHRGEINVTWMLEEGLGEVTVELLHDGDIVHRTTMTRLGTVTKGFAEMDPGSYTARMRADAAVRLGEIELSGSWTLLEC